MRQNQGVELYPPGEISADYRIHINTAIFDRYGETINLSASGNSRAEAIDTALEKLRALQDDAHAKVHTLLRMRDDVTP